MKRSLNILAIDDSVDSHNYIQAVLSREGHNLLCAKDIDEAKDHFKRYPMDLIISDQHMPRVTGLEFYSYIRERGFQGTFILATADGYIDQDEVLETGVDDLLLKPLNRADILGWVARVGTRQLADAQSYPDALANGRPVHR